MLLKNIFLTIFCFTASYQNTFAITLSPKSFNTAKDHEVIEILSKVIFEEIYKKSKGLLNNKIDRNPKPFVKRAGSINGGNKGRAIIEAMKQKNREKLALKRGIHPSKVKAGADIVAIGKKDNKSLITKISKATKASGLESNQIIEIEALREKVMSDHRAWRIKHLPTLKDWEKQRESYFKNIMDYKKNHIVIPKVMPVSKEDMRRKLQTKIKKDSFFVAGAFGLAVRDQKRRPTCSAFAGIRSVEVLLAQNKVPKNLSEQYFYWSSKPKCQGQKCSERGSWVGHGLKFSEEGSGLDIPLEKDCPYQGRTKVFNETQIPLKRSCRRGAVQIKQFTYKKTLDGLMESLRANKVVVAGISLTPNFYKNTGLILQSEKDKGGKLDSHAAGHSIVIVGYMKLPSVLNEGRVCFITTNSWGSGWGYGGHACLSEKWLLNNRNINPFVSIEQVRVN